ncbi:hypothetical protein DERF_010289, partial [Dermatophagoides farinae]
TPHIHHHATIMPPPPPQKEMKKHLNTTTTTTKNLDHRDRQTTNEQRQKIKKERNDQIPNHQGPRFVVVMIIYLVFFRMMYIVQSNLVKVQGDSKVD